MKSLIISVFLVCSIAAFAQEKPNSVYFELFGNGGLYSVNYDRLFSENFGARIGISYIREVNLIFFTFNNLVIMPVTLNYFMGKGNNKLELGAGIIYLSVSGGEVFGYETDEVDNSASGVGGTAVIGYRYQQPNGGFLFRVGFTPFFTPDGFEPYGGVSLGLSF